jgi:hypothetical protein
MENKPALVRLVTREGSAGVRDMNSNAATNKTESVHDG